MEIKAQITKKLQKYKADEIKTLYQLMLRVLSGNDDFRMVQNADTDDLRPVIEGETGENIDFAMESIISGGSLKLWQDIQAEEEEKVKLKKADRIERIASVMLLYLKVSAWLFMEKMRCWQFCVMSMAAWKLTKPYHRILYTEKEELICACFLTMCWQLLICMV